MRVQTGMRQSSSARWIAAAVLVSCSAGCVEGAIEGGSRVVLLPEGGVVDQDGVVRVDAGPPDGGVDAVEDRPADVATEGADGPVAVGDAGDGSADAGGLADANDASLGDAPLGDGAASSCGTAIEQEELGLTNAARADAGLPPLVCDEGLTRAARLHSEDMCALDYFSHTSADGRSFVDRIVAQGVSFGTAAENIAAGQSTAAAVHASWMASPGHRANILGGAFRRLGVGHTDCGGTAVWTQDFTD